MTYSAVVPWPGLPNPEHSRAVLIGTATYDTLEQLPQVANNLIGLRNVLTDTDLWGLPHRHCLVIPDPSDPGVVLDAVHNAALQATDALVVYMAGHGLLMGEASDLYLALRGSDRERQYRSVRYDDVRRELVGTGLRCHSKVVLLDCCYSGRALQGHMGDDIAIADIAGIDGTYVMTATGETATAWAPPGAKYTAFSEALINRLTNGVPKGPELLDMQTLYFNVRNDLHHRGFPLPQQRIRNEGLMIALVRNRSTAPAQTGPSDVPLPRPRAAPDRLAALISPSPAQLRQHVDALRRSDGNGELSELLAAIGAHRDAQGLAAIVEQLRSAGDLGSAEAIILATATRPAYDLIKVVATFRALDLAQPAREILEHAAANSVDTAASLAQLLVEANAPADVDSVLDAGLAAAQRANATLDLVASLWAVGLRDEVDRMLQRGTATLSGAETLQIADELRSAGRDQAAFVLYRAAAASVAERGAETVANLVQGMARAGRDGDSLHVARVAIATQRTAVQLAELAMAFIGVGHREYADRALGRAARMRSDADILDGAALLAGAGHEQAALELCQGAVSSRRTASRTFAFVGALRDRGRPLDAKAILERQATELPVTGVVALAAAAGSADRHLIIDRVLGRDDSDLRAFVQRALDYGRTGVVEHLADVIARQGLESILSKLRTLATALPSSTVSAVFGPILERLTVTERGRFVALLRKQEPRVLAIVLNGLAALPSKQVSVVFDPVLSTLTATDLNVLASSVERDVAFRQLLPMLDNRAWAGSAAAVDELAWILGPTTISTLTALIWRDDPIARLAAWHLAALLPGHDIETAIRDAAVSDSATSLETYGWLWQPFSRSARVRAVMDRIGYLIDATQDDSIPLQVPDLDPRIALGLVVCSWRFGDTNLRRSGSPGRAAIHRFVHESRAPQASSVGISEQTLRDAFAAAALGADAPARSAAIEILTAGGARDLYRHLLASLPTKMLIECVCRLYGGWRPSTRGLSDWETMTPLPPRSQWAKALDSIGVISAVTAGVVGLLGAGRVVGRFFHLWPGLPLSLAVMVVVCFVSGGVALAWGSQKTKGAKTGDQEMLGSLPLFAGVVLTGVVGLWTMAEWVGWWWPGAATVLLIAAAIFTSIISAVQSRALRNPCGVILRSDERAAKWLDRS